MTKGVRVHLKKDDQSLFSDIPAAGDEKIANFFYSVTEVL